jgi:hypothetical protein
MGLTLGTRLVHEITIPPRKGIYIPGIEKYGMK